MPVSEARRRANKKWNDANMKEKYDRIQLLVPKGYKAEIESAATMVSSLSGRKVSVSEFIKEAVQEKIDRENLLPAPADPPQD